MAGGDADVDQATAEPAWERIITSPTVGTLIVVLGVFSGLLGSVYSDELKKVIQLYIHLTARDGAHLFFASVVLTACAVFLRHRVIDRKREHVQKRFDAAADEIPELIRTLPEPAFQRELGIVFEKTASMVRDLNDIQTRAAGVTVVLQGFAALAGKFDGGRLDDRFAANLMVYVTGDDAKPWLPKIKFYDRDPTKLAGLLVLPAEFSAIASGEDQLPEFALPVPKELGASTETGGEGWRVLPGAPFAHSRNQFEHYATTSELEAWCRDYGDFTEREKNGLRDHFATHAAQISGFFCIPIREPVTKLLPEGQRRALGVLNIHWDKCDRLDNAHSAKLFEKATFPLQVLLAQMLVRLLDERAPMPDVRLSTMPPTASSPG